MVATKISTFTVCMEFDESREADVNAIFSQMLANNRATLSLMGHPVEMCWTTRSHTKASALTPASRPPEPVAVRLDADNRGQYLGLTRTQPELEPSEYIAK